MSSSFGGAEISHDPPSFCDVKSGVASVGGRSTLRVVMVATGHAPVGSAATFFKDSMRREAMSGTNIGCTLLEANRYQSSLWCMEKESRGERETYTAGMS